MALDILSDDVAVYRDVMVTMRDGVRLATDIYVPALNGRPIDGPFPTLLERTPYGKTQPSRSEIEVGMTAPMDRTTVASYFVRAGYALVYQDCRGRFGSEGLFIKYVSDGEDGFDTCAWIVQQPWCDGQIGTMGLSYAAHTQAALACLNPPGLAAMILDSGGFSNAFTCGIRQGGAFELKQATWAYNQAKESPAARDPLVRGALEAEDLRTWFRAMPWREGVSPVRAVPEYEEYLLDQWRRGTFDAEWKRVGLYMEGFYDSFPDVPVALMSSWYDVYVKTTFDNYAGLAGGTRPLAVIMGPGLHGNRNTTFAGNVSFGDASTLGRHVAESWLAFRRRWFDRWLKNENNGVDREPLARLFVMGGGSGRRVDRDRLDHGGRWIAADAWPLPDTAFRAFHLHPGGRLATDEPADEAAPFTYAFDPRNPVPTIGGSLTSGLPVFEGGGYDQREAERFFGCTRPGLPLTARPDILSFETDPLTEDLAVIGPIVVDLWVASDGPDTDFTAKLVDVYPPSADFPGGFALNVTDGIFRCRYRHSFEDPEPITPGDAFPIRIEPFATATLFRAGHRVRLDISSSNFPKFDVNPNTFAPEGSGRVTWVAINTVYADAARPSRVILPIVPVDSLKSLPPLRAETANGPLP